MTARANPYIAFNQHILGGIYPQSGFDIQDRMHVTGHDICIAPKQTERSDRDLARLMHLHLAGAIERRMMPDRKSGIGRHVDEIRRQRAVLFDTQGAAGANHNPHLTGREATVCYRDAIIFPVQFKQAR